jgi:hypothetical protein
MPKNIHLIFKTHLDVGFTDYASVVVNNYFSKYIPASLRVAREMRDRGQPERFLWTTGSWLIYEYLEQAQPSAKKEMEDAILRGDIAWHALPFTTHTELEDVELFRFGLRLAQRLDERFGRQTIAAKLTDVPGHTRGIVPLLAEAGIKFLHIGVNPGSTVPSVPPLFRWLDESGAELMVMYESGYGSAFDISGMEDALAFGHTSDNMGPQSVDEVLEVYRDKRSLFPGAQVFASTLDDFARKLESVRATLPVVTAEIGDSWIHGVGSDPIKVSRYRELLRLRLMWMRENKASYEDDRFFKFNRKLMLVPEHTWGMDEKTHLDDHEAYDAVSFKKARGKPNFKKFESSWVEKRAYISNALNALENSSLADEARADLESIRPREPDLSQWHRCEETSLLLENEQLRVTFDTTSAEIISFINLMDGKEWCSPAQPMASYLYQTFSAADYVRFIGQYILPSMQKSGWALEDFGKPGLEKANPESRMWNPEVTDVYRSSDKNTASLLFHMVFENEASECYGAPRDTWLRYSLDGGKSKVEIDLQWFHKSPCRMPEALWLGFRPIGSKAMDWKLEKLGQWVSPLSVVENGNRHLHAVGKGVKGILEGQELTISPLDSTLVAPGAPSLLDFNNTQPDLSKGMHFCLLDNLWGTNFPMWFEEDCRFRFVIELLPGISKG